MWKRLDDKRAIDPDFYVEEGVNATYEPSGLAERVYGWNGRMWPRINLHAWENNGKYEAKCLQDSRFIKLSCSYKSQQGQWWRTLDGVPLELFEESLEMLREAESKLKRG